MIVLRIRPRNPLAQTSPSCTARARGSDVRTRVQGRGHCRRCQAARQWEANARHKPTSPGSTRRGRKRLSSACCSSHSSKLAASNGGYHRLDAVAASPVCSDHFEDPGGAGGALRPAGGRRYRRVCEMTHMQSGTPVRHRARASCVARASTKVSVPQATTLRFLRSPPGEFGGIARQRTLGDVAHDLPFIVASSTRPWPLNSSSGARAG